MRKPFAFVLTAALALCANLAQAQPQNQDVPLRIVVGYAPGGAIDRVARIVADKLSTKLGTPVIVENRTGAGSRLSAQAVKAAPANQPTLLLANPAVMLVAPLVFPDAGCDPERDFRPVSHVNSYEFGVAHGQCRAGQGAAAPHGLAQGQPGQGQLRRARHGQPAALFWPDGGRRGQGARRGGGLPGLGAAAERLAGWPGACGISVASATFDTLLPQHEAGKSAAWEAWHASMPSIPDDATVSLGYSAKDMPQR